MSPSLPPFTDYDTFRPFRADTSRWLPVARDIARSHGLACTTPHVFATGTNLVLALDEKLILKIFPPFLRGQFDSERSTLAQLRGQLRVAIPEIVAEGERDGWPYFVITRLPGVLGAEAWPHLPEADKERVLGKIGETIAEVQRVPAGPLARVGPGWDVFLRGQIEGCHARHARLGLPAKFLDGIDELLGETAPSLMALDRPPVILTGEYIPENFLLSRDGSGCRLEGLIDFGDVMMGMGEYDLLGPSAFMTAGMPRRVRSLFAGFGYSTADITPDLKRRLIALMLLHRFSDLRKICIEDWQQKAANLEELQDLLWLI
jgi:hygromycin-B 7''-O-kinase